MKQRRRNYRREAKAAFRAWCAKKAPELQQAAIEALMYGRPITRDGEPADPEKFGLIVIDSKGAA